jgi:shikimate dehydrogenase
MYPKNGECLLNLDDFPLLEGVADLVYNPYLTEILRRAEQKGIKFVNGLAMLVAQAKKACELFIDTQIADEEIERIIREVEFKTKNIVFVGMPGCGKTTVSKILGEKLGRTVVDLDKEFTKTFNITPSDYITTYGEQAFRDKESEVVASVCKQSKLIIATGGGAVIREENRIAIKQNATVIWLNRALDQLSMKNRPLSNGADAIKTLYETRKKYYNSVSDIAIENDADKQTVVERVIDALKRGKYEN